LIYSRWLSQSKWLPLVAIIFIGAGLSVNAQKITVRGIVTDSVSGQLLEEATVSLFRLPKPDLVGRRRSDTAFVFPNLGKGNYILLISYQGYAADSMKFSVSAKDSGQRRVTVLLKQNFGNLMQVVVRASIPPAIVRNDTIAFNAGAYPSPPNSTVEDMLRKLPGIEIDKDGNVTMQGQKVDKITIDGKDFFLNDLRNASQNLPADLVAQVEVFDTQSERAKLTGIKESGKGKTINLKLKKKHPVGFFGKVYGGYGGNAGNGGNGYGGSDAGLGSFSVGGNATKFAGDQMFFATGNANNINNQFTGTEHQNGPGSGLQTLNNLQLNYRDAWTPKLNATINAGRSYNNSSVNTQLSRQTALGDSSILQNSISSTQNKNTSYNAYGRFEYALDSLTQINLNSGYSNSKNNSQTTDTVSIQTLKNAINSGSGTNYISSLGKTDNSLNGSGDNFSNSLDFRHAFHKKGRQVYFNISQNSSKQNQPAGLFSALKNFDSSGNVISNNIVNQQSTQVTNNNGYSINASYTEPVGKRHILDFGYALSHSSGHSDKESFDYDSLTGKYDILDSVTTNRFLNHTIVQGLSAGYNTTEGKYQFQIGLTGQLTQLENKNLFNNQNLQQQNVNWFPRASLLWDIGKGKNMYFNYSGSSSSPTIDQLQPVPDLTNPYLIKVGNPDLKQQVTHNLSARYAAFNSKTFENWQASISADYAQNQITSSSTVLPGGVQEVEYVNVQGVYHGSGHLTYGFPLGRQKNGNASVSLNGQFGHDISSVNGMQNTAANSGLGGSVNINFHIKDLLFIDSHINIDQTHSNYSLPGSSPSQTLNENYSFNMNYQLPGAVIIASYYDLQVTGSQSNIPAHAVSLWNASLYKSVFKNHCELRVSAYDLLNSSSSFSQSIGINYVQTQKTNLVGRIFLFSVIYRFRKVEG
jgi:hypothetical protein